jgi:hypothetical protein
MAGWQQVLRDDPPAPLDAGQANAIREAAVLVASQCVRRPVMPRAPMLLIGGALASAVAAAVFVAWSQPEPVRYPAPASGGAASLRQLQFATPGGTRIIWQFNPEFTLRETLP